MYEYQQQSWGGISNHARQAMLALKRDADQKQTKAETRRRGARNVRGSGKASIIRYMSRDKGCSVGSGEAMRGTKETIYVVWYDTM